MIGMSTAEKLKTAIMSEYNKPELSSMGKLETTRNTLLPMSCAGCTRVPMLFTLDSTNYFVWAVVKDPIYARDTVQISYEYRGERLYAHGVQMNIRDLGDLIDKVIDSLNQQWFERN